MRYLKRFLTLCVLAGGLAAPGILQAQADRQADPAAAVLTWPEPQRAFFQDGPGLLLTRQQRDEMLAMTPEARERFIQEFLGRDPVPGTPENELQVGIERRQRLMTNEFSAPLDVRGQILFLNGPPTERKVIDCGWVYQPLEIWSYQQGTDPRGKPVMRRLVVFKPSPTEPWKLWLPTDGKRPLYTDMMQYWMEQWEELKGRYYIKRIDLQNCDQATEVDDATGVEGMTGSLPGTKNVRWNRPKDASPFLAAPADLAAWAREAAATKLPDAPPPLALSSLDFRFPEMDSQRMMVRAYATLKQDGVKTVETPDNPGKKPEVQLAVDGVVESGGRPFEDFRLRYRLPAPAAGEPLVLALDRRLRPNEWFLMRLHIKDETSGAETRIAKAFRVPISPTGDDLASQAPAAVGELVPVEVGRGKDSLLLLPPPSDVVLGLWRADVLVTGERIKKVVYLVDGVKQLTRTSAPFSAEVRLARFPTEQVVRAEGYDAEDKLVAADEVIVNQPRGALGVWITEPPKGTRVQPGKILVKSDVSVPDGRRIEAVEFKVNDQTVATLKQAPWQAQVPIPNEDVAYVTVVATLDDGGRAEAVRFVRAPQYFEEVEVNLVELYVAVTDKSGNLVPDLTQDDFEVLESGKKQDITKFELVENLPLTVGILLDTSGSMRTSLVQAQNAASDFLRKVMTPRDRSFAVSFASRPRLAMPPTDDVEAVVRSFEDLQAVGDTALHDALVHSLYYFRGIKGQRALVLLSDGDDNASYIAYKDAVEYARRSGVAIYAIGYNLGMELGLKSKLGEIAETTGGKAFFTSKAEELPVIYAQIERELRSRYLVAYNSNQTGGTPGAFREVEVKVKKGNLKARTARGYYQ
ncbi:MAG TPA: VWA domain-containing protein [Thermoanaerobaculia bacterium]|nr:VWA domain-containing protein [Thermoanaerobaculia bacterium]